MRLFPRTARHRLLGAASAAALAMGAVSVPLAQADDLEDRRDRVEERVDHAHDALEESSQRTRAAAARLDAARRDLDAARAELERTLERLSAARELDREMELKLQRAQDRLAQAQLELATGRADLVDQREAVTQLVTTIYQEGDPRLQAFASVLNAEETAELTWVEEARNVVVQHETRAYDELRAAEILLEVRQQQVAEAEREVAIQRQEAAEHLVETQTLAEQAREAKSRVAETVAERRAATRAARVARQRDMRELQQLKAQERRIKEMILARARRAARAAARQNSGGGGGGYQGSAGGFLDHPVSGIVTSPFGYRTHPIYGYYSLHNGTDFRAYCGTPLRAVASGRVLSRYYSSVYGNRLYLNVGVVNGKNLTVVYNHASGYNVGTGQTVSRGQIIGYSGNSGWSTACHLHFTVLVNGKPVNPMNWM